MTGYWVCKFWLLDACKRGRFCRALHEITPIDITDVGTLLENINRGSLSAAAKSVPNVTWSDDNNDHVFLSSYNWVDEDRPTIYVPGAPSVWTGEQFPFRVDKDNSNTVERSTSRCAKYPFEPLFRSLEIMKPDFDVKNIDLVTNRNSLRKLFKFVSGDAYEPFRIDVQTQGTVTFLCRWESELETIAFGSRDSDYGHNFEKKTTKFDEDLFNSTGHHRVIQYSLGGIQILVQSEADACFEDNIERGDDSSYDTIQKLQSSSLHVLKRGRKIQQSAIVELKTKNLGGSKRLDTAIPQLWFSRTPNCIIGYHDKGEFQYLVNIPVKEEIKSWESKHANELQMLVCLVNKLREFARASENKGCVVVCQLEKPYGARMSVYDSGQKKKVLPDDIVQQNSGTREL